MIASLQNSKSSPLYAAEWRFPGEPETLSEMEHCLCDKAFALAALWQDDEALSSLQHVPSWDLDFIIKIDRVCLELESLMDRLDHLRAVSSPDAATNYWDLDSALLFANLQTVILDAAITVQETWERAKAFGASSMPQSRDVQWVV